MSNTVHSEDNTPLARLEKAIGHAAHLLPAQGPIGVFIHHNTLHAFQHLPFEEAVVKAAEIFGAEPFLSEEAYREEVRRGRIRIEDIETVLEREPDVAIWPRALSRRELRRALVWPGPREFTPRNIEWAIEEEGLLDRLRDDLSPSIREAILAGTNGSTEKHVARALFAACFRRLAEPAATELSGRPVRPRDAVLAITGEDADLAVHPLLIRLGAVYLDQGQSYWPMPGREKGFYLAVRDLYGQGSILSILPERVHMGGIKQRFRTLATGELQHLTALEVVHRFLAKFHVPEAEWENCLTSELLALPGWAGLMHQLEHDPGLAPHETLSCSLVDFLAVRLTLMEVTIENIWRASGKSGEIREKWQEPFKPEPTPETAHLAAVANLFDAAQLLGHSADTINSLSESEFQQLRQELGRFDSIERRRILHLAYERRHEEEVLGPLMSFRSTIDPKTTRPGASGHNAAGTDDKESGRVRAQVLFCIDEREESIRRALEEATPEVETYGAAGFFGVAVNYRGVDDAHGVSLCPVVVKPQHAVIERPTGMNGTQHRKRQQRRRLWAELTHNSFVGSRTLLRGWVGTAGLGLISLFPLIGRILAPRHYGRLNQWLSSQFLPDLETELTLMREDHHDVHLAENLLLGFTIEEKAARVASVLRPAGLVSGLARIVVILGHGSTSLNNPHESAHDCGACGGRRGGPNARLFAAMANNPQVRAELRRQSIDIPAETWFIGGYHDTCNDDIILFDEHVIPATHDEDMIFTRTVLDAARAGNALERSRRFEAAWADKSPEAALRHVQERAEHLAEPRPEYGHCTNATAIVGRRSLTRGLFLDRRAFLISYDPTTDQTGESLSALLGAAGPVCAGINLEYYFSFVDNERYGCGTKLPHNVTGLIGVMNGHSSDLRTGLPWQMVEIHEPVRLLLIVENSPAKVLEAAFKSAVVRELIENQWIRLATIDPVDGRIEVYRNGQFEPFNRTNSELPVFPTSPDWFLGKLDYLPIVRVGSSANSLQS